VARYTGRNAIEEHDVNARDPLQPIRKDEAEALGRFAARAWDEEIVPRITDYIAVPAKSPMFDAEWQEHGFIDRVVRDAAAWVERQRIAGLKLEVIRLEGRTPVIFFDVPATRVGGNDAGAQTVCLYGHLDKQPEFEGWKPGFGPWTPRFEDGRLYGRGGADDGYAIYAAITAIRSLDEQGIARPRCVGIVETCEESGSPDLPFYVDALRERLGAIALVVCLDSGAGNYDQLWLTTSLRGNITGTLKVEILTEGVHSGDASGVVPSSFRILRRCSIVSKIRRAGVSCPRASTARFPSSASSRRKRRRRSSATRCGSGSRGRAAPTAARRCRRRPIRSRRSSTDVAADALGHRRRRHPGAEGRRQRAASVHRVQAQPAHAAARRRRCRGASAEEAARGQRAVQREGDVLHRRPSRPRERGARSDRLERADPRAVARRCAARGIERAVRRAVRLHRPRRHDPADGDAAAELPKSQMMVCGVLGPKSNAHGPNEFLHVPYGKKLTAAVAQVIAATP
jgi:acetylornithine deacetylase/succinyl-diaminopimelate desuccinylase-like protein